MSRMLQDISKLFQRLLSPAGSSARHGRDMKRKRVLTLVEKSTH
jgi:hypothetical protein